MRHCDSACGWVAIVVIVDWPAFVIKAKVTGKVTSPATTSGSPVASSSKVRATTPSTEFSIGTRAKSAAPLRTASRAAVTFA